MEKTKEISKQDLLEEYFALVEERHAIENSKYNWPEGWDYRDMVIRVNEISPLVRHLAHKIKLINTANSTK